MSFLDRVTACNTYDLTSYIPFTVNGLVVGWVRTRFAELLADHPAVFAMQDQAMKFSDDLDTPKARTDALAKSASQWVDLGLVRKLRREMYPARLSWSAPDLFQIDRALVPFFGIRAYGVHLNGFIRRPDGIHLWVGKRSADRLIEPGKLDNLVAGGQPAALSIFDNLIKECEEEACLPYDTARTAVPVGTVQYCFESESGLKPDTLFCFDLELPEDFTPVNQDGEIASFDLMPVREALALIEQGDSFKFNVSLVILDFAIRHGLLTADSNPDYEAILAGLHAPQPTVQVAP